MNSAPQVHTAELSDAELDNVSGGLAPHASAVVGPTTVSDADVLAQVGTVQGVALGTVGTLGAYHQAGVNVSF
ncbi:class IIb bacteriocin, lactobin A/cerein 7B family [Streptomyces sp. NPDC003758]|uniref:Class IIb bacteriocin, lactobin A/cerein 7B family n=1 Tax=Streptomyces cynarae TaxID=2981134 RepID=A0ABY6E2Z9_9ACTN|nr:class IIb bacteriocin, lactobin A/cerein 7B family [Streptomyces cynarae]UXY19626.1 class IIb bacteriocin, lactobin A/cerein 7B family [Streptomyces cynarae]